MRKDQYGRIVQPSQEVLLNTAPALFADVLRQFGEARLRAIGGSMFPAIRPRDTLTVRRCGIDEIERGDVVLVREDDRLYAHRVVDLPIVNGVRHVVTRGDAHWHDDPARPAAALLGRVVAVERGGRTGITPHAPSIVARIVGLAFGGLTQLKRSIR